MAIDGYGLGSAPAYVKSQLVKQFLNNNRKLIHNALFPMTSVGAIGANGLISVPKYTANDGVYIDGKRATNAPIKESDIGKWSYLIIEPEEISDAVKTDIRDYNKMIGAGGVQTARGADELIWSDKISKINLAMEKLAAAIAIDTDNYDANNLLEKSDKRWNTSDGYPLEDCTEVLENMMITCQEMPNIMWFAPDAWTSFTTNANVLGKFASTSTKKVDAKWIVDYFAAYGIQDIRIGWAAEKDESGTISTVWSNSVGFTHSTTDLSKERFGTNYVDNSNIELTKGYTDDNKTTYLHSGRIMTATQVISTTAGGLITGINS